ncbi:MAG: glycosyltransferase [Bacteroidota bacterium]
MSIVNSGQIKISVIIPTLNEGKLLKKTLQQFSRNIQKQFSCEIIISDGGSSDDTIEIGKESGAIIVKKENAAKENISIGRNNGAKKASGELYIFLNADTRLLHAEIFFKKVCQTFSDNRIIAATCFVYVNPEESTYSDTIIHRVLNYYFYLLNFFGIGMGRGECHIVRKEAFVALGGYNETIAAGEDFEFFSRLRRVGKIKYLPSTIVYESPRRYRKYGYRKILFLWFINAFSVLFSKKSISQQWEAVR